MRRSRRTRRLLVSTTAKRLASFGPSQCRALTDVLQLRIEAKARGVGKLLRTGRQIQAGVADMPEGLLLHENLLFSLLPPHLGMRQYWRDLDSLERWTRELPHKQWWEDFLRDSAGTGFWHETYFMRGGIEAIYDDMSKPIGMMSFAHSTRRGATCSAREVALDWAILR